MMQYKFPVASHSYFHVLNQAAARELFLRSDDVEPVFGYAKRFDETIVAERRAQVDPASFAALSLDVVYAGARLQHDDSPAVVAAFRRANERAYGAPKSYYVDAILHQLERLVRPETAELWEYIARTLGPIRAQGGHDGPTAEVFERYKTYFAQYAGEVVMGAEAGRPLQALLQQALDDSGLTARGWHIDLRPGTAHARVHHRRKSISVGIDYVPRSSQAAHRIVAHEIYGHALRGPRSTIAEGEGVALVLEQLVDTRFIVRRSFRYLAAALGWGVGERAPMTFRQVYEIIWRAMVIMRRYDEAAARQHAFDECARVFRGGRPDVAGAVYLKDSIYFAANLTVWERLTDNHMQYNDFVDVLEGRREVL